MIWILVIIGYYISVVCAQFFFCFATKADQDDMEVMIFMGWLWPLTIVIILVVWPFYAYVNTFGKKVEDDDDED